MSDPNVPKPDPKKLIEALEMCLENLAEGKEPVPWANPRYKPKDKKEDSGMI